MPACKEGCCPDVRCDCSNDCECVLPDDQNLEIAFENPFLFTESFKPSPEIDARIICPCKTKEELAEYVKPIEPRFDMDVTENNLLESNKNSLISKFGKVDDSCENGVGKKDPSKDAHTHAPHGHSTEEHSTEKCCDEKSCTGNVNSTCCGDESCHMSDLLAGQHDNSKQPKTDCCKEKTCSGITLEPTHKHPELNGDNCCKDNSGRAKSSSGQHNHSNPKADSCCNDNSCGAKDETPRHAIPCCDDKDCRTDKPSEKHPHANSCCEDAYRKVNKSSKDSRKHSKPVACCDDDSCEVRTSDTYKQLQTSGACCEDKRCGKKTPLKRKTSREKYCPSPNEKAKAALRKNKQLPRQSSLPDCLRQLPSSQPNSPTKIARVPNFQIRSNSLFETPIPYRKTTRSQSLAEVRLGNLLSERRPSCFQTQMLSSELRDDRVPDPHHGHQHHHLHEYHHAERGHHGDENKGNHLKVEIKGEKKSCCENPNCEDDASLSSHEELQPLVKDKGFKIDTSLLVVRTTKLRVQNLCCPKEAQIVYDELAKLEGIEDIRVNVIGRVVHVGHYVELTCPTKLMNILNKRHLGASIVDTGSQADAETGLPKALKIRLLNVTFQAALLAVALAATFTGHPWYMWVAIAEIIVGVVPVLKKVYHSVRNYEIDLNVLITVTVIGTLAIQEWIEGAAVVFVFTLAGFLQRYCFYRVQKTISGLMLSQPSKAVMACTGECIPVEEVPIGSIIAVRQGELIPLDGIVVKGVASVDESSVSGEATPVEKILECPAYSGTVIQNGYLEIETTSSSTTSTISKISTMVEDAQSSVSPTELLVNKFAKFYTPLVILVAALVFLIPLFLGLGGVEAYEGGAKTWGVRALIILVTACPCALLMATPTAVICGINGAARLGALIKGGTYFEALGQLRLLAFDKTGTLTEGKFQVVDLIPADNATESDVLRWAAALESKSSHPLAAAVVSEFTGECVSVFVADSDVLPDVSEFCTIEGQGIRGVVEGHEVQVGNRSLLEKLGVSLTPKFEAAYISYCTDAKTVIFVCVDGKLALMISLADIIRWESRAALTWLHDLGVHLCMLTGDAKQTADAVKKELNLESCVSDMKPDDKLNWITDVIDKDGVRQRRFGCCRRKRGQLVGMVGDGVNDGPALAASDVGIAFAAGGSALAVEAAGVALMNNSVLKVPEIICLSRFCRRVILQNIFLSVLLKLVFVIVALTGFVRVWMAVLADVVGLLAVILNGLRPLNWQPPRTKKKSEPPRASFRRKRPVLMFETVV